MPFDPLNTDEPNPNPIKVGRDMDTVLLGGCSSFVATAVLGYLLAVWPFFVVPEPQKWVGLATSFALGWIPFWGVGAFMSRKTGLPGASGLVGGSLAAGIFLYLRLDQIMLGGSVRELPKPEYPASWVFYAPTTAILVSVAVAVIFLRKDAPEDGVSS